jgi:photosystem II stability/assembly factor-like uncharacterized protein
VLLRATDGADSWQRIESGLPGNFGFPMVISARGELFIAPLEADEKRYFKDGKFAIYRSRDAGKSWTARTEGLPTEPQFVGVLRDAMAVDTLDPAGVYVGTTMGELFSTRDAGDSWQRLPGQFSRIESVKVFALD